MQSQDVTDSDEKDVTREYVTTPIVHLLVGLTVSPSSFRFSLRFSQIVQQEQAANFISRLHDGKMNIIPWPVIKSREFYKMFSLVKKRLDKQMITHAHAGIFLQTLKTLMAKIKVSLQTSTS
jgi:hypothetical protein